SNSVRLVVYSGAKRIPSIIFNEKVLAGLGRDVGEIAAPAAERALAALDRFQSLVGRMGVVRTRTVATAAVREGSNGDEFLGRRTSSPLWRGPTTRASATSRRSRCPVYRLCPTRPGCFRRSWARSLRAP